MSVETNHVQMREISATSWSYETKQSTFCPIRIFFLFRAYAQNRPWNSRVCINAGRSQFKVATEIVFYKLKLKWLDILSWNSFISDNVKTCWPILWMKQADGQACVDVTHIVHNTRKNKKKT
jgi:hypothetical protein